MTTVLTLASPWKPSPDRQIPITNLPYYLGGSLRRLEGAGIELSSVQLVHKFAATLSNTMIHKQFNNDKKGFRKFGPLAEGREVSNLDTKRGRGVAAPPSPPPRRLPFVQLALQTGKFMSNLFFIWN